MSDDLGDVVRAQLFTEEWLDGLKKNEKDGKGSKVVAFKGNHWFFKQGEGKEYTTHLKQWLEMHATDKK